MLLGENIKIIRKEKGLTQKELSLRSGVAEITIRKIEIEKEKCNPKIDTLKKLQMH